jgi:hypothetical protein
MPRSHSHGRIGPHQRDTNDEVQIIGAGETAVLDKHTKQIRVTGDHGLKVATKKDYRLRIRQVYLFLQALYPEYCERGGVVAIGANDQQNYPHASTHDLKYVDMNAELIKAFVGHKNNGKQKNKQFHTDASILRCFPMGSNVCQVCWREC